MTRLRGAGEQAGIRGTLILATEGINGTIAAPAVDLDPFMEIILKDPRFAQISLKRSTAPFNPFPKFKVRHKKEIVSFRQPGADPRQQVGTYVDPKDWNALISEPGVITIDTRNAYEVAVGRFRGASDPGTENFTQFARYVEENLDPGRDQKVAMYCTGGIRCERATAYLKAQGFREVYHLRGGILNYLAEVPPEESLWEGDCFVFDNRVAVDHHLRPTDWVMDEALNWPVKIGPATPPES